MIRQEEVYRIGYLGKPHGVKGEIAFHFTDDVFDRTEDCDYLVCLIDGILVPFYMEEYRFKTDTVALVKFEGIETSEQARSLVGIEIFYPLKYAEELDELSWSYFVGFRIVDHSLGELGNIVDVDESTINTLFLVSRADKDDLMIPAQETFIKNINHKKRVIEMELPEGLID